MLRFKSGWAVKRIVGTSIQKSLALNENFKRIKASGEQTTRETMQDWNRSRRGKSPRRRISIQNFRVVAQVGNITASKDTEKFADLPGQEPAVRWQATAVRMLELRLQLLHLFETQIY